MKNDAAEDWIARAAIEWRNERRVAHIDAVVERVVQMNRDLGHGQDQKYKAGVLDQ
jgi:hypothetical protein